MKARVLGAVTLAAALWGCSSGGGFEPPTSPAPPAAPEVAIVVDVAHERQTIDDVGGGNFIHTFAQVTEGLDPVGRLNLEGIGPRHARLRMALEDWEPENDDGDPGRARVGGFRDDGFNHGAFLAARELAARGVELTASIWDVPDWMVENPGDERGRRIPREQWPELAESMGEWLRTARDLYGADFAFVSFNEADIGVNVALSSTEHAALVADVGARLERRGIRVKWLLGDCSNMAGCVAYSRPILEDAAARPRLGVFAFHSWDSTAPDSALIALGDFATSTGLPVRTTEGGWDAFLWQRPADFPTWTNALRLAKAYLRVLRLTGAQSLLYWQMLGRDYNLNDGSSGYPAWQVLQQMQRHLPGGSVVLDTAGDQGAVHSLAARDGGDVALYLVNVGTSGQPVRVDGLPGGTYRQVLSNATGVGQERDPLAGGGTVNLVLPAESLLLLTTRSTP